MWGADKPPAVVVQRRLTDKGDKALCYFEYDFDVGFDFGRILHCATASTMFDTALRY